MADYDWFDRDYSRQKDSNEKLYAESGHFTVYDRDTPRIRAQKSQNVSWDSKNSEIQATADEVWCDYCQCSIRPSVVYMRTHRRLCKEDPYIAGSDTSEEIKDLINGIRKHNKSRTS